MNSITSETLKSLEARISEIASTADTNKLDELIESAYADYFDNRKNRDEALLYGNGAPSYLVSEARMKIAEGILMLLRFEQRIKK